MDSIKHLSTSKYLGISGDFCKGHTIVTGMGFIYLICKQVDKPTDNWLSHPELDVQSNAVFGEQHLRYLDPYKNSFDILRKLYLYATSPHSSENTLAYMDDDDIITELARLMEQRRLLMIEIESPFGKSTYSPYSAMTEPAPEKRAKRDLMPPRPEQEYTEKKKPEEEVLVTVHLDDVDETALGDVFTLKTADDSWESSCKLGECNVENGGWYQMPFSDAPKGKTFDLIRSPADEDIPAYYYFRDVKYDELKSVK